MIENDWLAADLYRLGDRSVTKLRKCVIIVARLSADYQIEVCMLENDPTGLDRAEIERVVGNQYSSRLMRQQQGLKGFIGIKRYHHGGSRREQRGNRAIDSRVTASTAEGRVTALRIAGAPRRRSKS